MDASHGFAQGYFLHTQPGPPLKEYACRNEAYLLLQMVIFLWPLGNNHFVAKFLRDRQKCSFFERRMAYLRQAFSRRRKRQKLRHTASLTHASALGRRRRRYLRHTYLSDLFQVGFFYYFFKKFLFKSVFLFFNLSYSWYQCLLPRQKTKATR